jgi:hypothetical protein
MAVNKQRPPFHAEHLGSLLRPRVLTEKRMQLDGLSALDIKKDEELHRLEDDAIDDIVKVQLDLGFHAITDGEYRRSAKEYLIIMFRPSLTRQAIRHQFWGVFFPSLDGFEEIMNPSWDMFRTYVPDTAAFSETFPFSPAISISADKFSQLSRGTSPANLLSAPARSNTLAVRIWPTGLT